MQRPRVESFSHVECPKLSPFAEIGHKFRHRPFFFTSFQSFLTSVVNGPYLQSSSSNQSTNPPPGFNLFQPSFLALALSTRWGGFMLTQHPLQYCLQHKHSSDHYGLNCVFRFVKQAWNDLSLSPIPSPNILTIIFSLLKKSEIFPIAIK